MRNGLAFGRAPASRVSHSGMGAGGDPWSKDNGPVGTGWSPVGTRRIGACVGSGIERRGAVPLAEADCGAEDTEVAMSSPLTGRGREDDPRRVEPGVGDPAVDGRPVVVEEERVVTKPARTSAAAAFALAFGVAAFVCVLIVILSPVGLVLGIIGVILGVIGLRAARRVGITGKGVAIGGLVLSGLAIVISIAFAAGMVTVLNNDSAVERIEQEVDKMRDKLPDNVEVPQP